MSESTPRMRNGSGGTRSVGCQRHYGPRPEGTQSAIQFGNPPSIIKETLEFVTVDYVHIGSVTRIDEVLQVVMGLSTQN
jgi:hypothetical protein